ncbi:serine hydrolase [Aureibaculum conchae]|uniref:serine hydrolase n=1 Tax=Aureibaculum sp. 2308TA14-22 TaxID=3108392 RepID=UPI00339AAA5D
MKNTLLIILILIVTSCKLNQNNLVNNEVTEIEKKLLEISNNDGYSGTVLIAKDNKILFQKAYGYANLAHKVPNKMETKFGIASMSKMFTAVAIMQLKEQDKLNLDDTVGKILPNYPNKTVRDSVTIHQLLTHTSGLSDFFNDEFEFKAKHTVRSLKDYFDFFKDDSILFTPGSQFSYSNAGYVVLGLIIEELSDKDYYNYVREHIFVPTNMNDTDNYETDSSIDNLAEGYIKKGENNVWKTSTYMKGAKGSSAGGGYTTANDLFNFSIALKNNTLISEESFALMTSSDYGNNYGYGFGLNNFNDTEVYGHNGGAHGVSAELDVYKDKGYTVVTLSNRSALNGWVEVRSFIRKTLAGATSETDMYLNSEELVSIYKTQGYDAALTKSESLQDKLSERYIMDAASKYRDAKDHNKAIDLLKIVVARFPESFFGFSILADTYLDKGNKELAIENYKKSLKLEPKNTWAIEKLETLENDL